MGVDPMLDISQTHALEEAINNNDFVIAINAFQNDFISEHADLVLPLATFLETSGTFVNVEGLWQPFQGVAKPSGNSRQGWKILTALAKLLLPGDDYDYIDSVAVRNELKTLCRDLKLDNLVGCKGAKKLPTRPRALQKVSETAIYAVDEMLRHSDPLQNTQNMLDASCIRVNRSQAEKLGLADAEQVHIKQGEGTAVLSLAIDDNVPMGCVWIPTGVKPVQNLSTLFGSVEVEKVS